VINGPETAGIPNPFDPAGKMEDLFAEYTRIPNHDEPPDPQRLEAAYAANGMRVMGKSLDAAGFKDWSAARSQKRIEPRRVLTR
jgi:hypothetical protein